MKRLYYLTPSLDIAEDVCTDLKKHGISDRYLHIMSNDRQGIQQHHLHEAGLLEKYDIPLSTGEGALWGCCISSVICATALIPLSTNLVAAEMIGYLSGLFLIGGTSLGAMSGAVFGFYHENRHLKKFHKEIVNGMHLLMVDTDAIHKQEVEESVHHFEALDAGEDEVWSMLPYHVKSNGLAQPLASTQFH
jgi:hypothetical protein